VGVWVVVGGGFGRAWEVAWFKHRFLGMLLYLHPPPAGLCGLRCDYFMRFALVHGLSRERLSADSDRFGPDAAMYAVDVKRGEAGLSEG